MASIRAEKLLIEGFGPCLPTNDDVAKFCKLMFDS